LAIAADQWKPSYLRKGRQHRSVVDPGAREQTFETGLLRHLLKAAEIDPDRI
jgi:hypothetical protein